jgi:hypothetical protein
MKKFVEPTNYITLANLKEGTVVELRDGTFWTIFYRYLSAIYTGGALVRTTRSATKKTHIDQFINLKLYDRDLKHATNNNLDIIKIPRFIPREERFQDIEEKRLRKKNRKNKSRNKYF